MWKTAYHNSLAHCTIQIMSNLEFNEPTKFKPVHRGPQHKGIIGLLIKHGFAKNVAGANLIMIGIIIVMMIISYFAIFGFGSSSTSVEMTDEELLEMEEEF